MKIDAKKLLVLGSTKLISTIVQKAKDMGIYTIVTDNRPFEKAPAKQLADTTRGEIVKLATIVMAAMEIMSSWKISSATGQSGPWTNLNRTCPI